MQMYIAPIVSFAFVLFRVQSSFSLLNADYSKWDVDLGGEPRIRMAKTTGNGDGTENMRGRAVL